MQPIKFEKGIINIGNEKVELNRKEIDKVRFFLQLVFSEAQVRGAEKTKNVPQYKKKVNKDGHK